MYMQVVSIEHSLERPHAELGDAAVSPIFHRVSARCPVLHLFGYIHISPDDAAARLSVPHSRASRDDDGLTSSLHTTAAASANQLRVAAAAVSQSASHEDKVGTRGSSSSFADGPRHAISTATMMSTKAHAWPHNSSNDNDGGGGRSCSVAGSAPAARPRDVLSPSPCRVTYALEGPDGSSAPDKAFRAEPPPNAPLTAAAAALSASPAPPHSPSHPSIGGASQHMHVHHAAAAAAPSGTADTGRSLNTLRARYVQRRACLHVHGVYPALLLPQYDRRVSAAELAAQLEAVALRVLTRQGVVVASQQLVHDVRVVHRLNVYGYRPHAYTFYEVRLIDPNMLPKVADVLQNTTEVGGRQWQLYDAHNRYHTQFMVRWGVNGVAPFQLPPGHCHVRLPTAPELAGCAADTCGDSVDAEGGVAAWSPVRVRRRWRPDELGRFTTAEVELDVSGADLLGHAGADGADAPHSPRARNQQRSPMGTALNDNLSYTRRMIKNYFKEHGVPDALRVADTIAMERHLLQRAHLAQPSTDTTTGRAEPQTQQQHQQRRYGNVTQLQRADPTVRWLRQRMLAYLAERAEARATPSAPAAKLEKDEEKKLTATAGATSGLVPTVSVGTAAQLQEQQAMRQRLVADYRMPGGGRGRGSGGYHHHHHHGHHSDGADSGNAGGGVTTRVYADGQVDAPSAPPPHVPDPRSAAAAVVGGALYIGFSSDSLQLTGTSQGATQRSDAQPSASGAAGGAPVLAEPLFAGCSSTAYAEAAAAPTQELWAALSATTAVTPVASLRTEADQSADAEPTGSTAERTAEGRSQGDGDVPDEKLQSGVDAEAEAKGMQAQLSTGAQNPAVKAPDAAVRPSSKNTANDSTSTSSSSSSSGGGRSSWSSWASWSSVSSAESTVRRGAGSGEVAEAPGRVGDAVTAHELCVPSPLLQLLPPTRQDEETALHEEEGGRSVYEGPTQQLRGGQAVVAGTSAPPLHPPPAAAGLPAEHLSTPSGEGSGREGMGEESAVAPSEIRKTRSTTDEGNDGGEAGLRLSQPPRRATISNTAGSSAAPAVPIRGFAEGDVMAFVRVHPYTHGKAGGVASSASATTRVFRVADVLAVARVGRAGAATVELQWLLPLCETTWAAEERALVRRGSWLRPVPTSSMVAASAPSASGRVPAALMLGEMMLGDVRDRAPVSVLQDEESPLEDDVMLTYAAALSAPTQRLPPQDEPAHHCRDGSGGSCSEEHPPEVRVWPVACYTSPTAYMHHQLRLPTTSTPFMEPRPALRVLCRYAYHVEAQVLTAVPEKAFPRLEAAPPAVAQSPSVTPRRVSWAAGDALAHRGAAAAGGLAAGATPHALPALEEGGAPAGAAPRRSARTRTGSASSCILLTQPQPLHLAPAGAVSPSSSLSTATTASTSSPSDTPALPPASAGARREEPEEDAAEDTLLFSSSSSSSGSHGREECDVSLEQPRAKAASPSVLLGHRTPSISQPHTTASASPPRASRTSTPLPQVARRLSTWRLVTTPEPPAAFTVGGSSGGGGGVVVVHRSVQTAVRRVAPPLPISLTQVCASWGRRLRRRPRESAVYNSSRNVTRRCEPLDDSGDDTSEANASLLRLSNVSAASASDEDVQQPLQTPRPRPSRGSAVRVSDGEAVVVASMASASSVASLAFPGDTGNHMAALTVRDSATPPRCTLHRVSSQLSSSPSQDAVHAVTVAQHEFLRRLRLTRAPTSLGPRLPAARGGGAAALRAMLQRGGLLGNIADGLPRTFTVSAAPRPPRRLRGAGAGDEVRVRVSAVTWPWGVADDAEQGALMAGSGLVRYSDMREETPSSIHHAATLSSDNAPRAAQAMPLPPVLPPSRLAPTAPLSARSKRRSSSHVTGLSLSTTQQPQNYLQCVLRVLYVEVLLNRRPGEPHVATCEVLAVGLGQATTAADSRIAVQLFCVHVQADAATPTPPPSTSLALTEGVRVVTLPDEAALLLRVRDEVRAYDPDVLLSWEGFKYGLGYLSLRYRAVLQRSLAADLSRVLQHHEQQQQQRRPAAGAGQGKGREEGGEGPADGVPIRDTGEGVRRGPRAGSVAQSSTSTLTARLAAAAAAAAAVASAAGGGGGGSEASGANGCPPSATNTNTAAGDVAAASPPASLISSDTSVAPLSDLDDDDDDGGAGDEEARQGQRGGGGGRLAALFQNVPPPTSRVIHFTHTGGRSHGPPPPQPPLASTSLPAPPGLTAEQYAKRFGANVRVMGRICTSMGKDLRKDLKMPSYSLPMVHLEVLGQPLPYLADSYLAELFNAPQRGKSRPNTAHAPPRAEGDGSAFSLSGAGERETALRYLAARVAAPHRIACKLNWFTKLLEFSRMYGILAEEVITRGSQFKVEATLLRLAEPLGYAMLSPSLSQVHRQPRIECIPLVMQPKSDLYRHDPVVVLDFRSLYPSIVIAYNLCYSTCLGMVQPQSHGRLGVLPRFKQSDAVLAEALPDDGVQHDGVVFTPNGAMFVPPSTRIGLLPTMVQAVLDARFEVQAALKHVAIPAEDVAMQQRLQEQQLALKMLANVTYGYTAASFTGRMPCVDLAEAIVSLGRQTLQRAIALIHSTPEWRAEVVYGDTDSLFVRLAGRSKADAFRIGQAMADAVTLSNPAPVRLQFEKVLLPCLLLVKKRYTGYMWTSPTQTTPTFLAKGIEVVRRDQCPVTGQVANNLLRLLFDGASATALRRCYGEAVQRLQSGSANPALCIFRRAVKLGRYRDAGDAHLPLAARLALQEMERDVTQTPYWGERLPYVVVRSTTSVGKLSDQVLHPERLMHLDDTHSLDASYYITRNVNSTLDRMLYLVGINVAQWYQAVPRRRTARAALLNLPTFMAAQAHALQHQPQHRVSRLPAASPAFVAPQTLSPVSRLARLSQLAALMQGLCLPPWRVLQVHGEDTALLLATLAGTTPTAAAAAAEEISDDDDDDSSISSGDDGVVYGTVSSSGGGARGEDITLTDAPTQEVIDVELLLLATQGSRRAPTADPQAPDSDSAQAHPDSVVAPPSSESVMGARPLRQRRRRTVTLDSFYPRTLCVVCEAEAVGLDDVRRQHAILAHLGVDAGDTEAAGAAVGPPPPPPLPTVPRAREHPRTNRRTDPHRSLRRPLLLLPPICTKCWGDPFTLHLHVQERCRSLGHQSAALRGLCARCITSGGDGGPRARDAYRQAVADMEDMAAFFTSSLVAEQRHRGGSATSSADVLEGPEGGTPRHILGAVEVSPGGVPRGCVSVDCAVGFGKKWVASQLAQWRSLQAFLQRVL